MTERVELTSTRLTMRRTTPADAESLKAIRATSEVNRWWGDDTDPNWMASTADGTPFAIVLEDKVVGFIQTFENDDPKYHFAGIDLFRRQTIGGPSRVTALAAFEMSGSCARTNVTTTTADGTTAY